MNKFRVKCASVHQESVKIDLKWWFGGFIF